MASFFEKLKKGMGVEEPMGWTEEEKETAETTGEEDKSSSSATEASAEVEKKKPSSTTEASAEVEKKKPSSTSSRKRGSVKEDKVPELKIKKLEIQTKTLVEEDKSSSSPFAVVREVEKEPKEQKEKKWPFFGKEEGQLAIDVYQTENDLVIQSAIAGVRPENLDILMEREIITIKGNREKPSEENGDYFTQECFWGPFSREVILPAEVDPGRAVAEMKNGILTIRIPRILREKKRKIIIRG